MIICEQCHKEYNETNINIPSIIPDGMCSFCGTQLTEEEIINIVKELQSQINK